MERGLINSFLKDEKGQSLMEIIVGLSIGAVLIGTASFGIAFMLRSTTTNQNLSGASQLTQGLMDNAQSFANASWQNVYSLNKGSANQYFLMASGTSYFAVVGQEGVPSNDITNGLVGKWGFDENSASTSTTVYDTSGNNNNGALTNGPTRASSTCKMSNCLSFDGSNDYAVISDPASETLDPTSKYSLSVWLKYATTTSYGFIISKSNGGAGGGYELFRNTGSGAIRFSSCDAAGSCAGGYFDIVTDAGYNDNNWHYVAATAKTNDVAKIYVDGVLVKSSGTVTQNNVANAFNLLIGARGAAGASPFNGYIDDVRVYNRALSASEVSNLYNSAVFTRYFYVENVCRTNDSSANISTTTSPCPSGTADDPLTQKATAITQWLLGVGLDQVSLSRYLTRWKNFSIRQTDWMSGAGQDGPFTTPGSAYSTSTNIAPTSTFGSFQIQNLSQQ